jgi:hypothetical protein
MISPEEAGKLIRQAMRAAEEIVFVGKKFDPADEGMPSTSPPTNDADLGTFLRYRAQEIADQMVLMLYRRGIKL